MLFEAFRLGGAKALSEIYAAHGAIRNAKPVAFPNDMMWWDDERVETTVDRAYVESHLRPDETLRLDQQLGFGDGLTDDTYFEWIVTKAKRIFLVLVDIGVPDQIFAAVDDSWDDDDLPLQLDQVARLQLRRTKDERLDRKFFERQFTYLMRHLKPEENLVYEDVEIVPLQPLDRRHVGTQAKPANSDVDKVCIPGRPDDAFIRRKISLGDGPGQVTEADFLSGIERMKARRNQHVVSLWASYIQKSTGYLLLTPIHEWTLTSVLTTLPPSMKILAKRDRRILVLDWMHCLADAVASLHTIGLSHGQIKPSNIFIDMDNKIFLGDVDVFGLDPAKEFDHENYDYGAPELSSPINTESDEPQRLINRMRRKSSAASPEPFSKRPLPPSPPASPSRANIISSTLYLPAPASPPSPSGDPIKGDIYSLGCIYLELITLLMKRSTRTFSRHRASKAGQPPSRKAPPADSSFHHNPAEVESWASNLTKDARKKEDRLFRGITHLLSLTLRMLSPHPMDRPSARFCEERVYEILTNNSGVEGTHCGSARMWRVVDGMVEVARPVPGARTETPSGGRGQSWLSGRGGSRSGSASQSGSKSSGSGPMGRGMRERPKARPWKAPIYSVSAVVGAERYRFEQFLSTSEPQGRPLQNVKMQAPVVVMNTGGNNDRQTGRKAQLSNITAAKTVADIIRSCLGPKAMLKMLLDPMGGIVLTNDGHAILREIEVSHPAAKSMIELSRTQDEEVGDGTTTVIILAGEILAQAVPQLERNIHPVIIISAFKRALADAIQIIEEISLPVDIDDDEAMYKLISSSIGTKFVSRWSELMCNLALKAVRTVTHEVGNGKKEVDIKRYARVEKVPGGEIEDSRVLDGVMLNKDITHPKMRRRIENPRIVLLDCSLEYKKGESQTNIEISKEEDWNRILQIEEEQVKAMCDAVLALKPDLVITEKGVSDLAQHYLLKGNVTALRRVRKSDNNRIARATGATIVNRVDDLTEEDVGLLCGLFEIEKIGDEYFTFLTKCRSPKACTILLRGPSKDILNEIDRNLADAMAVARNVMFHPRLAPGGGATEMAISVRLGQLAKGVEGVQQWPYKAVAEAMEVIPRTLVQNAGQSPVRVLTELRAKQAEGGSSWGIDGDTGKLVDMKEYGVWEPEAVKLQSIKTAIESACLLLRVDDICSAKAARMGGPPGGGGEQ
ncbi:hypothetical protein V494_00567 [Pseudogymnoascus sp. VKM F-4513 (FW-928)]|nr:hypothetical protein V494_00567 [Pseudogymnoascus sp. VKM F-4513 (FW-928)]